MDRFFFRVKDGMDLVVQRQWVLENRPEEVVVYYDEDEFPIMDVVIAYTKGDGNYFTDTIPKGTNLKKIRNSFTTIDQVKQFFDWQEQEAWTVKWVQVSQAKDQDYGSDWAPYEDFLEALCRKKAYDTRPRLFPLALSL